MSQNNVCVKIKKIRCKMRRNMKLVLTEGPPSQNSTIPRPIIVPYGKKDNVKC